MKFIKWEKLLKRFLQSVHIFIILCVFPNKLYFITSENFTSTFSTLQNMACFRYKIFNIGYFDLWNSKSLFILMQHDSPSSPTMTDEVCLELFMGKVAIITIE